jgi:hypothetical protein
MSNVIPPVPPFERTHATQMLIQRLLAAKEGETLTYTVLSLVNGIDVQKQPGRGYLATARKVLRDEYNIVFVTLRTIGLKRGIPAEVAALGRPALTHIGRTTRQTLKTLSHARVEELDNEQRVGFHATTSCLGVLRAMTTPHAQKRLTAAVQKTQAKLPVDDTITAFRNKATSNA